MPAIRREKIKTVAKDVLDNVTNAASCGIESLEQLRRSKRGKANFQNTRSCETSRLPSANVDENTDREDLPSQAARAARSTINATRRSPRLHSTVPREDNSESPSPVSLSNEKGPYAPPSGPASQSSIQTTTTTTTLETTDDFAANASEEGCDALSGVFNATTTNSRRTRQERPPPPASRFSARLRGCDPVDPIDFGTATEDEVEKLTLALHKGKFTPLKHYNWAGERCIHAWMRKKGKKTMVAINLPSTLKMREINGVQKTDYEHFEDYAKANAFVRWKKYSPEERGPSPLSQSFTVEDLELELAAATKPQEESEAESAATQSTVDGASTQTAATAPPAIQHPVATPDSTSEVSGTSLSSDNTTKVAQSTSQNLPAPSSCDTGSHDLPPPASPPLPASLGSTQATRGSAPHSRRNSLCSSSDTRGVLCNSTKTQVPEPVKETRIILIKRKLSKPKAPRFDRDVHWTLRTKVKFDATPELAERKVEKAEEKVKQAEEKVKNAEKEAEEAEERTKRAIREAKKAKERAKRAVKEANLAKQRARKALATLEKTGRVGSDTNAATGEPSLGKRSRVEEDGDDSLEHAHSSKKVKAAEE